MFKDSPNILSNTEKSIFLLITLYPIFLITGNLFVNFFYIVISIISIFNFKKSKVFFKSNIFYLLIFFLVYLFFNLFFSLNIINSYPRVIKFLLIILFVKEISTFNNDKTEIYFEKIIKLWVIVYFVVTLDVIFEIIFGFNSLGFRSSLEGRIASFFGDELVVGAFYHFFSLIVLSYLIKNNHQNLLFVLLVILIISVSFMIGERANFIRLFFSIFLFSFLILKINYLKKIAIIGLTLLILGVIFYSNDGLKKRYYNQVSTLYSIDGINKYFKESQYGAHQITAYEIFKNNILFGVGLKNFREESKKSIYENQDYYKTSQRQATHPHQVHLELLSELGLIGYVSFFILIFYSIIFSYKNYLLYKNPYQLSSLIFIISCLIPIIPSGSIFSTFYGGIFWFSFGLMVSFNKNFKFKI